MQMKPVKYCQIPAPFITAAWAQGQRGPISLLRARLHVAITSPEASTWEASPAFTKKSNAKLKPWIHLSFSAC